MQSKIIRIFSGNQKEKLITEDGKRNLYFDRQRKNFIKFSLEVKTTCSTIYKNHKEEINKKIQEIYGQNINYKDFAFLIVELIANKFEQKPTLIDLKIGMDDTFLFNVLQNSQLMLCYLPYNNHNNSFKKNVKNTLIPIPSITNDLYKNVEMNNYKTKDKKELEIFLSKTIIHYYDELNKSFSKEKIMVNEKEITIYAKRNRHILIKEIREMNICLSKDNNEIDNFFRNYIINGDKPKFCLKIVTSKNENLLIGRNTFEHFVTLSKAIERAGINYQNYFSNTTLNNKIIEENSSLFATNNIIAQSCFTVNDFVTNKEKRKILFKDFHDINLAQIVNNIMEFKSNIKKKRYNEAINKIKNMLEIIKEKMTEEELDKYKDIITKEKIGEIEEINKKINDICGEGEININEDENKIIELNKIINIYMFDSFYIEIRDKYISKYYEDNFFNNESLDVNDSKLRDNVKLLLGKYFINIFNFNKEEDINYLGNDEVENLIQKVAEDIMRERLKKRYVIINQ